MGNPNNRGNKPLVPSALKLQKPGHNTTSPARNLIQPITSKSTYPKIIQVIVEFHDEFEQDNNQLMLRPGISRRGLVRLSTTAKKTLTKHPEKNIFLINANVRPEALCVLGEWMHVNADVDEHLELDIPCNQSSIVEKRLVLYSAATIFAVPRRFSKDLRAKVVQNLKEPLFLKQIQLVWERLQLDKGIINLFAKKLVQMQVRGTENPHNEEVRVAIHEYIRTQPGLGNVSSARKLHQAFSKRQAKRARSTKDGRRVWTEVEIACLMDRAGCRLD